MQGDVSAVRVLLQQGAEPNAKDNAGWTPLVYIYHKVWLISAHFWAKRGPLLGLGRDRMALMATFRVPSKISFLLAMVNQAPLPALMISNMVSYIHEEPW